MDYELFPVVKALRNKADVALDRDLKALLECEDQDINTLLTGLAWKVMTRRFNKQIYLRGIIEFSNFCKNDCFYCGLRKGNKNAERYRMTKEEILQCCSSGYSKGVRTFVLQSGEDKYFSDDIMCDIIRSVKTNWPDCAITLSIGEKKKESYAKYKLSGADRYLLREESTYPEYYTRLHPVTMSCEKRLQCIDNLKELGYQVGAGFMVDSPYQTVQDLMCEIRYIRKLHPEMIGIGPYISHIDTPFRAFPNGSVELTLRIISIFRLMLPDAMIPATTAIGTLSESGLEDAFLAGANVIMTNLTPQKYREKYKIYDGKTDNEIKNIKQTVEELGLTLAVDRGDHRQFRKTEIQDSSK